MPRRTTRPGAGQAKKPREQAPPPASSVRDLILDRTIYLMGKLGTTDVSIRAIAKEAEVNVAAVNYYFSSKEQMLEQMSERFRRGFDEVMRILEDRRTRPEERLRRWAAEVMRYLVEYPGVLALMELQMAAEPRSPFGRELRAGVERAVRLIKAALRELVGADDENRLAFKLTLLISALAGPFPRDPARPRSPAQRARFLDLLVEHLKQ
jgi:AcrR family transcriptional regulator